MPYINVRVAGPLTKEQKQKIASGIAHTITDNTGKPLEASYIVFDEVSRENWAKGETLLCDTK